ncbi:MAG: CRTAC1 family protein [Candidatus Poribacteria bacterium]|nr:CRTAC1 family protein [Candidatus Poribacteria bacterium]
MKNSHKPSAVSNQLKRVLIKSNISLLITESRKPKAILALAISMLSISMTLNAATFVDVTNEAGIRFQHSSGTRSSLLPEDMGSGAGFADIDNDGDIDLYIVNIPGPFTQNGDSNKGNANALYRNNGDGTFTDITRAAGVGHQGYGMGCVFADYDGDADLDLYLTNYGKNVLYRNNGNATFTDVTETAGVGCEFWSTGAAFADVDGDTDLDLYVCNYVTYDLEQLEQMKEESLQSGKPVPSALNPHVFEPQDNIFYRNNGDGTFTDATDETGIAAVGGRSMQAIFSDFDNDNDLDLYVANDTSTNHIYRNDGGGAFTDVSAESWAADFRGSMGLTAGDYDADGDIDLFMSHWVDEENALYRNLFAEDGATEQIRFVDESYTALLAEESIKQIGWGTTFFDYDNDGDLDIFVTNGSTFQELRRPEVLIPQADMLFRNDGDETFTNVSQETGIASLPIRVGRGATFGDYDNDGDVDIFIVNNHAPPTLLRNEGGNRNNWLQIKLVGTGRNRDAIGAKIRVKTADRTQVREIYAGDSYMSFSSLIAEFGVGNATQIETLQVTWQNGETQKLHNVPVNQRIRVPQQPSN